MPDNYMRASHFLVTLKVGERDHGTWQTLEGGDVTAEATMTKPGGMQPAVAVPAGATTTDKITLTKKFTHADAQTNRAQLLSYVGKGNQATVGQQPLDYAGDAFGTPIVNTGVIESVSRPAADAESEDLAVLTVVIAPNG